MAAATYAERPRHLRLVTAEEYGGRGSVSGVGECGARARADLVYVRRRLVAAGLVVVFMLGLGLALGRAGTQRAAGLPEAVSGGAELPIAQREYVVQPGDTLWKIARALQPEGDVRPLVQEMARARGGAPLRAGERIRMP